MFSEQTAKIDAISGPKARKHVQIFRQISNTQADHFKSVCKSYWLMFNKHWMSLDVFVMRSDSGAMLFKEG